MYLDEQVFNEVSSQHEAFSYCLTGKGEVLQSKGRFVAQGLMPSGDELMDLLPAAVVSAFHQFVISSRERHFIDMMVCGDEGVWVVNCRFKRSEEDIEFTGFLPLGQVEGAMVPIDKLPYPVAMANKEGEILQLNRSFIDFFLDHRIIAKPILIQDVIKTNELSPEEFEYSKMINSGVNTRAVLCQFKGDKNHTFLLNLIPVDYRSRKVYLIVVKDLTQFIDVQQSLEDQKQNLQKQMQEEFATSRSLELRLLRKTRLESLGDIASGIFYELNQPLLQLSSELNEFFDRGKKGVLTNDDFVQKSEEIQCQIVRMQDVVNEIMEFSTFSETPYECLELKKVLNIVLEDVSYQELTGLVLVLNQQADVLVMGRSYELEQIFVNILINSIQSLQAKSMQERDFTPRIKINIEQKGAMVHISFWDNGLGASTKVLKQVLKPFYTTRKALGGSGLGLFVVNNLMRKMEGWVIVDSMPGKYFETKLGFPLAD
ncbi:MULTISPECIES: sensor histidine kinase [unclassified Carboxylicivirga]|uniref:sensor histidine kinase n=1 Tax=Carboxylicivirga TaxID=1628153 RepID=UPI003D331BEC